MKAFSRLLIVAVLLACFGLTPSTKSQAKSVPCDSSSQLMTAVVEPQDFAPTFDPVSADRITSLEARVNEQAAKIKELEAKLEKLTDPIAQAPKRTTVVAVQAPAYSGPTIFKRLANGQMVECNDSGCKVITSGLIGGGTVTSVSCENGNCDTTTTSVYTSSGGGFWSGGPVRRALSGRR